MIYAYAAPPPYPSGYSGPLAPRELKIGTDVDYLFATASTLTNGCIVVADTTAPDLTTGAQGSSTGSALISDWPFCYGTTPAVSQRETWVYLGAGDWGGYFVNQLCDGALVTPSDRVPTINFVEHGNGAYDIRVPKWDTSPPFNSLGNFPPFVRQIYGVFQSELPAGASPPSHTTVYIEVTDEESIGATSKIRSQINVDAGTPQIGWDFRIVSYSNVTFDISPAPATLNVALWRSLSYIDPILNKR